MESEEADIQYMECVVFRLAQNRWKLSAKRCSEIFREYEVLDFLRECYGILHIKGFESVLDDVETLILSNGGSYAN